MQNFDFDRSEAFQEYLKRIDVEATDLERVKRKWYEKNVSTTSSTSAAPGPRPSAPPPSPPPSRSAPAAASPFKVDAVLLLQTASIILTILSFFIGGALRTALLLQFALWSLILYRQVGSRFALTSEFAALCFQTDAAHYAVYSLLFWAVADRCVFVSGGKCFSKSFLCLASCP
jgi:hypothetical protein